MRLSPRRFLLHAGFYVSAVGLQHLPISKFIDDVASPKVLITNHTQWCCMFGEPSPPMAGFLLFVHLQLQRAPSSHDNPKVTHLDGLQEWFPGLIGVQHSLQHCSHLI